MSDFDYKVRCDKHTFKPYEYCEMCMIRSEMRVAIDTNRKHIEYACGEMNIALREIHKILDIQRNRLIRIVEVLDIEKDIFKSVLKDIL